MRLFFFTAIFSVTFAPAGKGAIEFDWSFPVHGKICGYLQLFSGYGNSLIEYNKYSNSIGLGVSLTDWL